MCFAVVDVNDDVSARTGAGVSRRVLRTFLYCSFKVKRTATGRAIDNSTTSSMAHAGNEVIGVFLAKLDCSPDTLTLSAEFKMGEEISSPSASTASSESSGSFNNAWRSAYLLECVSRLSLEKLLGDPGE